MFSGPYNTQVGQISYYMSFALWWINQCSSSKMTHNVVAKSDVQKRIFAQYVLLMTLQFRLNQNIKSLLYWEKENTKLGFSIKMTTFVKKGKLQHLIKYGFDCITQKRHRKTKITGNKAYINCNVISY